MKPGDVRIYEVVLEVRWEVEEGETDASIREMIRNDIDVTASCGGPIDITAVKYKSRSRHNRRK